MPSARQVRVGPIGALAALLLMGLVPTNAAIASPPSPVVFGADNVVTADRTASLRVHIPRPATYPNTNGQSAALDVTGAGRTVGFFLQPEGAQNPGSALSVLRFNNCDKPACRAHEGTVVTHPAEPRTYGATFATWNLGWAPGHDR